MTVNRSRNAGILRPPIQLSAAVIAAALLLVGCSMVSGPEAQPSETAPTPTITRGPDEDPYWTTQLDLSDEQRQHADDAYLVLMEFWDTYNLVAREGGTHPGRALKYTTGDAIELVTDGLDRYEFMETTMVGRYGHSSHEVIEVAEPEDEKGRPVVKFRSCVDPDTVDYRSKDGDDRKNPYMRPAAVTYTIENTSLGWKYADLEDPREVCS